MDWNAPGRTALLGTHKVRYVFYIHVGSVLPFFLRQNRLLVTRSRKVRSRNFLHRSEYGSRGKSLPPKNLTRLVSSKEGVVVLWSCVLTVGVFYGILCQCCTPAACKAFGRGCGFGTLNSWSSSPRLSHVSFRGGHSAFTVLEQSLLSSMPYRIGTWHSNFSKFISPRMSLLDATVAVPGTSYLVDWWKSIAKYQQMFRRASPFCMRRLFRAICIVCLISLAA